MIYLRVLFASFADSSFCTFTCQLNIEGLIKFTHTAILFSSLALLLHSVPITVSGCFDIAAVDTVSLLFESTEGNIHDTDPISKMRSVFGFFFRIFYLSLYSFFLTYLKTDWLLQTFPLWDLRSYFYLDILDTELIESMLKFSVVLCFVLDEYVPIHVRDIRMLSTSVLDAAIILRVLWIFVFFLDDKVKDLLVLNLVRFSASVNLFWNSEVTEGGTRLLARGLIVLYTIFEWGVVIWEFVSWTVAKLNFMWNESLCLMLVGVFLKMALSKRGLSRLKFKISCLTVLHSSKLTLLEVESFEIFYAGVFV